MPAPHLPTRALRTALPLLSAICALALLLGSAVAQAPVSRTLIPIGSGYEPATLERFAQAAAARDTTGNIDLLVLPITFGTSAASTTPRERRQNLELAEQRRGQLEAACNVVRQPAQACRAILVPMLIRDDAFLQSNLALFTADVDGMYILGGDQTVAMQVVADTPTEVLMAQLYAAGAVVGGNSAGAAVASLNMIAGYTGDNGPENGFQQGSVDLWLSSGVSDTTRGLIFGMPSALLDQHALQRGRIGRLINAAWSVGLPGVGVDAETGATIVNESQITDVSGRSAAFVVEFDTYGSAGRYAGPASSLAISRATTHLIPTGGFGYDLAQRRPTVGGSPVAAPSIAGRSFSALRAPAGAGPLLLGGDLSGDLGGPAAARFVALSGGSGARIVVLTAGYAKAAEGRAAAKAIAAALQPGVAATVQWFALDARYDSAAALSAISGAGGVWLTSPDQSRVLAALGAAAPVRSAVIARWQAGAALLADNAAAAAAGGLMTADPPMPTTTAELEEAAIIDFRPDGVTIQPGLGLLPGAAVEPRMVFDRHWGRLYNLIAAGSTRLGLGIDVGTAVEISATSATTWGGSVAITLDGRAGAFGVGSNGALSARYVVLDSFVDGDVIIP